MISIMISKIVRFLSAFILLTSTFSAQAQMLMGDHVPTMDGDLVIHPVGHASFAMAWDGKTVFIDPTDAAGFNGMATPDMILVTDIHGDHFNADALGALAGDNTRIVAPAAVIDMMPAMMAAHTSAMANGEEDNFMGIDVEAIPMYNTTAERMQFHEKGRGNGYVMDFGGTRVYISGDTEDIPEMRALQDIDVAFICFNLPYTMTENQAASAVNEFRPDIVYPYHYRGSDVDLFASMVNQGIEVRRGAWY